MWKVLRTIGCSAYLFVGTALCTAGMMSALEAWGNIYSKQTEKEEPENSKGDEENEMVHTDVD